MALLEEKDKRQTRGGHRVGQRGQRTTTRQQQDKRKTRGGHRVGQRGQRTTTGQEKDQRRQEKDK